MSDPIEDLSCIIERLREDMQGIFANQDRILRMLCKNISELRDEIIELTGAVFSLCEVKE